MANNRVINGIAVDDAVDNGKAPIYNSTTKVFDMTTVGGSGTVTSVAMSVPTGLTISGSPVTTTGTLAVVLDTGYVIPLQSTLDAKAPLTSPTFATSITGSYLTASEMLITDASKNIVSAPVATYPSLTELTYVKGVTSALQTQLNAKQATITFGTNVQTALGVNIGSAGAPVLFNGALGTPASGTLTNCTGLPASGLATGTTPAASEITLGENSLIILDAAGSADGKFSGIAIKGTGGATIAIGEVVYLSSVDSRWELADADAATTADRMLGIAVTTSTDGAAITVLLQGQIRADAKFPALTIGSPVYVGETPGAIQVAIPTGADNVIRRVGYALTADEIYFCPSMDSQITVA